MDKLKELYNHYLRRYYTGVNYIEQHLDEGEALNVYEYSLEEIMNLIKFDKLNDAKSLCALQFYFAKIYKNN